MSACLAIFGKISLICMPGTLVLIGWNGPRTSAGAFGFGSQVSSLARSADEEQHDAVDVRIATACRRLGAMEA